MFLQLWGPFIGRRHDVAMLRASGLLRVMQERYPQSALYGDPAYPLSSVMLRPFRGAAILQEAEQAFNVAMSSVRESVEWSFGMVTSTFQSLAFQRKEKMLERPLAQSYQVAAFLVNCRTCMRRRNQISDYFGMAPPSLLVYLRV